MKYLRSNEIVAAKVQRQTEQVAELLGRGIVPHLAILRDLKIDEKKKQERGILSYTAALRRHIAPFAGEASLKANKLVRVHTTVSGSMEWAIGKANDSRDIHGILVMSPTVKNYDDIVADLDPRKDIDRMSATTREQLTAQGRSASPATPQAVREQLESVGLWTPDIRTTLVGRGRTVGRFVDEDLRRLHGDNYDKMVHVITGRNSGDLPDAIAESDVVIVAAGVHHQIRPEFVHDDLQAVVGVCIEDIHPEVYEIPRPDLLVTAPHNHPEHRGIGAITSAIAWGNTLDAAAQIAA